MKLQHSLIHAAAASAALTFGGWAFGASSSDLAIVVTQPETGPSFPGIDFFQASVTEIKTAGVWTLAPLAQVKGLMRKQRKDLGPIPSIPRSELLAAMPGLVEGKRTLAVVIPSLQRALDTLAVDGAIVVDCEPVGQSVVKSCGLYYYDRSEGRVVASARKEFKVGISDADRWAPALVSTLKRGMENNKSEREKAKFNALLERKIEGPSSPYGLSVGFDAVGENLKTPDNHIANQVSFGLTVLVRGDSAGFGLEGGTGTGSSRAGSETYTASARKLGLVVNVRAKALDDLLWETDVAAGVVTRSYESTAGDLVATREAYLAVRPGMGFRIAKGWSMGLALQMTRYFMGSSESRGDYAATSLNPSAVGALFRIKADLF